MRGRDDWRVVALLAGGVQLLVLGLMAGGGSFILTNVFRPDGEAIAGGVTPYEDQGFEYPPLALPFIVGPAALTGTAPAYRELFSWVMVAFAIATVILLAWALRDRPDRMRSAVAVQTGGILILGGLAITRFDLVPALLGAAAVAARERALSATWGLAAGLGAGVKAVPLALAPLLARGDRRPVAVIAGIAAPLALAAGLVAGLGDEFSSAVSYHTDRDLQVESLGASVLIGLHELGADARVTFGAGSFNLEASGADFVRALSTAAMVTGWLWVLILAWQRRAGFWLASTAAMAMLVVAAPVLSPQFLFWLLPLSAAAFGLGRENLLLIAAIALTRLVMEGYPDVPELGGDFVWPLFARNLLLVAYLIAVMKRLHGEGPEGSAPLRARSSTISPSA